MRNDDLGVREVEVRQRKAQDLAARRVLAREQVKGGVGPRFDGDDSVREMRHLGPVPGWVHDVVRELAAVAIGYRGNQPLAIIAAVQLDFGNAGKLLADNIRVLLGIGPQPVKVNLLVEIGVLGRALVALRKAGVIET